MKRLPARNKVNPSDTWDLGSLFGSDKAWETAFLAWEKQIAGYSQFKGKLATSRSHAGRLPAFRRGVRSRGRTAGHLRLFENRRRHGREQISAHAGPVHARRRPGSRGSKLHPAGNPGHSRGQAEAVPGRSLPGAVRLARGAAAAVQGAYAGQKRRAFAGAANRDVAGGLADIPPVDRRRSEIRGNPQRQGPVDRTLARHVQRLLHSPQRSVRNAAFHQYYRVFADHQNALAASLSASVQRDIYYARAGTIQAHWKRPCFRIACLWRFTTI